MKILICDDNLSDAGMIRSAVEVYGVSTGRKMNCTVIDDPQKVMDSKERYDIAFLDIKMGNISGITLAGELTDRDPKTAIFFVTGYAAFMDRALDQRPFRFYEKPIDRKRLFDSLDKALEYFDDNYVNVYVRSSGETERLAVDSILYVEISGRKTRVTATGGVYCDDAGIDSWENMLTQSFFRRIHKSYIINLHYVTACKYTQVKMTDGTTLGISSKYRTEFHAYWLRFLGR